MGDLRAQRHNLDADCEATAPADDVRVSLSIDDVDSNAQPQQSMSEEGLLEVAKFRGSQHASDLD
jgi:hypothetical protein